MRKILREMSALAAVAPFGESVSQHLADLAVRLEQADGASRVAVLRDIRALYRGGMGSFQDLVLQDRNGVLPEHPAFDRLRHQLYEEVWRLV
ncbi:DUF6966 domain-containing protein [Micromonospora sp. H33]|uniref:DUF6966 domain-containing protein n=1 Tax=Micromonospora sp. H33 TaxID=3452215 RepID=UPI003F893F55